MGVTGSSKIKISCLGQYEGYSQADYDGTQRHSFYFEASDGVRLATDYYLPTKGGVVASEPLPVIFHYTPYGRAAYGRIVNAEYGTSYDPDAILFDDWGIEGLLELSRFGYVICIAEVRGTGASFGYRAIVNSRAEAQEGKELVEWLAKQPFCNGKVGTAGYSYTGQSQMGLLSTCPKGLCASFVCMTDFDRHDGWFRGGVPRAFGTHPDDEYGETEEEVNATLARMAADLVPVDDDPDRTLLVEALREHMQSNPQIEMMQEMKWRDSYWDDSPELAWNKITPSSFVKQIEACGAAMYMVGGIYDVFRRETIMMYENLDVPKKLFIGPWYHMDQKADVRWDIEMLRWFDRWLKGIDNGIDTEQPMAFRMASYNFERHATLGDDTGAYRFEGAWPAQEGARDTLYLSDAQKGSASRYDDGELTPVAPAESCADFCDPFGCGTSAETSLTANDKGTGIDQIGLTFTGAELANDYEIVGHPMVYVGFSLEHPGYMDENLDADLFVCLSDYNPATDEAFLITEGQIRASLREEGECPYDFLGLPWHPDAMGSNKYLELGKRYDVCFDMMPTSYVVKRGHCLRVTITNSLDRMWYLGRKEFEADPSIEKPVIRYYFGGKNATRVELPNIYMNRCQ